MFEQQKNLKNLIGDLPALKSLADSLEIFIQAKRSYNTDVVLYIQKQLDEAFKIAHLLSGLQNDNFMPQWSADGIKRCTNPSLYQRLGSRVKPVTIPLDMLNGDEQISVIRGANKVGKTELLRTLGFTILLDQYAGHQQSRYDDVFFLERDPSLDIKSLHAGELVRYMHQVGQTIESVKKVGSGKRVLVCIDDPAKQTAPSKRAQIIAQIAESFAALQDEAGITCKLVINTHAGNELDRAFDSSGITHSSWVIPPPSGGAGYQPKRDDGSIKRDNSLVVREVCGDEMADLFIRYRDLLPGVFTEKFSS